MRDTSLSSSVSRSKSTRRTSCARPDKEIPTGSKGPAQWECTLILILQRVLLTVTAIRVRGHIFATQHPVRVPPAGDNRREKVIGCKGNQLKSLPLDHTCEMIKVIEARGWMLLADVRVQRTLCTCYVQEEDGSKGEVVTLTSIMLVVRWLICLLMCFWWAVSIMCLVRDEASSIVALRRGVSAYWSLVGMCKCDRVFRGKRANLAKFKRRNNVWCSCRFFFSADSSFRTDIGKKWHADQIRSQADFIRPTILEKKSIVFPLFKNV